VVSKNPSRLRFMSSDRIHITVPRMGVDRLLPKILDLLQWFERTVKNGCPR